MTELAHRYYSLLNRGREHHAAVGELAKQLGVDRASVVRALQRAGVKPGATFKASRKRERARAAR
jgi:DNA-binding MurR/RpiR family transcriptional regulator